MTKTNKTPKTNGISDIPDVRYCLYARKSMESEERQALSIDSQIKEMEDLARQEGLKIVVTKTESHSAKRSGERLVFNEMIQDLRQEKYNAILTWAPDRLSRNAGDLGQIVDLMDKELLVAIKTCNQSFSNSPNDKFLFMILCSQAKLENDNRGINVQRGQRMRVEMGLWPSMAPLGYLNSKLKDEVCHAIIDPERAPVIRQIFEKVAFEKWSGYDVLHWLREIGFTSRTGKFLPISRIYDMLRLPFYYGRFEYPKKSGKWYDGKHEPIISKKLYDLVQHQLSLHSFVRKSHIRKFEFVRLMRCGHCGSGITAEEKFKHLKNGDTARYVYYMCTRGKDRKCPSLYVNEKDLIIQLAKIIDTIELDQIGMRDKWEWEIERFYKIHSFVSEAPIIERSPSRKEFDLRAYAKMIFEDGTYDEKRGVLSCLKSKILIKDKKVYLDNSRQS